MIIFEDPDNLSPTAVKIKRYLELYDDALGFADWQIYVRYCRVQKEQDNWPEIADKADCEHKSEYYKAFLRFDLELLAAKPDEELAAFVRHELLHIIVGPLADFTLELTKTDAEEIEVGFLEERTVSDLERMPIMKLE